ncbi:MAG: Asp-tRNA(Asn)/Glu-tRNA(Gln) amidotransferase subunit GatA [Dethiobacter sp.]|jgi:aspartyl-tRNA(Asn)/glutamyl-tRNA(Gln) amidotransferase subunit A|nr:MAG: Asp-tRNA(Asn)/Glu-tRNA(Gln) amidotransferase subunit GatA [Dethiobacter sp.]
MELYEMTAYEAATALQKKEVTSLDLTESVLKRISEVEDIIKGFITVFDNEKVLLQAQNIDKLLAEGKEMSPLAGIPMALKDNMCTRGVPTTCASKILKEYRPPYDAHVAEKLQEAGTILVGKANMDEFAMGSSTENSSFYHTRNPWDISRVPGGSSGGSASLVAADEIFFSLGSDTGGSVRQPASLCGVVGLKPTYGLISRYGLIAFASSLDQIGPLTKDVRDCALVLDIIAGNDPRDSTSVPREKEKYAGYLGREVRGFKIGLPREYFEEGIEEPVRKVVMEAMAHCGQLGVEVEEVSMPNTLYALPCYYLVATAEASSNLARYDGIQYGFRAPEEDNLIALYRKTRNQGFGPEVKRRIMLGTYALSSGYYDAYYLKALKVRTLIRQDFERVFQDYDLIVTPTSPTTAFVRGEKINNPLTMYLSDIFTITANLAGVPAISIPCGLAGGLPVGLQVIGRPFDEGRMLQFCFTLEKLLGFKGLKPSIPAKGVLRDAS